MFNPPETQVLRVDDLLSPSAAFLGQLHSLLGVPRSPALVNHQPREAGLSSWQLDTMLRKRSIENIRDSQDTLRSIVRLVNQIENMPVGEKVRGAVDASLAALRQVRPSLAPYNVPSNLGHSFNPFGRQRTSSVAQQTQCTQRRAPSSVRTCWPCCTSLRSTSMRYTPRCSRVG